MLTMRVLLVNRVLLCNLRLKIWIEFLSLRSCSMFCLRSLKIRIRSVAWVINRICIYLWVFSLLIKQELIWVLMKVILVMILDRIIFRILPYVLSIGRICILVVFYRSISALVWILVYSLYDIWSSTIIEIVERWSISLIWGDVYLFVLFLLKHDASWSACLRLYEGSSRLTKCFWYFCQSWLLIGVCCNNLISQIIVLNTLIFILSKSLFLRWSYLTLSANLDTVINGLLRDW